MTRLHALLIATALWAALYLPGLGSIEIKGEEGRRILPAVTMMETGNWVVPFVGGRPYLRKPPMIHWLIAGSFYLTGHRDDWAARLPSALAVLGLVVTIVGLCSSWLTPSGALLAAICAMTNLGMLEKGRLSELEALFVAETGIAIVCWLVWWKQERSPWLTWTVPYFFLGLGLLTKVPLNLLFFYTVVLGVLWYSREMRRFLNWPHLVGVLIMLAMFAAWGIPYFKMVSKLNAAGVWVDEFAGRVAHSKMTLGIWIENFWNNFENFLPWLLFTPLWWSSNILEGLSEEDRSILRGVRFAVLVCGCGLILIPGVLSRYTLPVVVPASLLVALVLSRHPERISPRIIQAWRVVLFIFLGVAAIGAIALPFVAGLHPSTIVGTSVILLITGAAIFFQRKWREPGMLSVVTALIACFGTIFFVVAKAPRVNASETARPLARLINNAVPEAQELYVVDPGYQPALFYLRPKCLYLMEVKDIPKQGGYVLMRTDAQKKFAKLGRTAQVITSFPDRGGKDFVILQVNAS